MPKQRIEVMVVVRLRDEMGHIVGEVGRTTSRTRLLEPREGSQHVLSVHERRQTAESIKSLGMEMLYFSREHALVRASKTATQSADE